VNTRRSFLCSVLVLAACGEAPVAAEAEPAPAAPARARLSQLRADQGRFAAQLEGGEGSVELYLATREAPLAYRGPVIHARVAALLAPGLVPETTFSALPLAELSRATRETRSRELLAKTLRVLADGKVRAAIVAVPPPGLRALDVTDEVSGGPIHAWESALVRRDSPPEALRPALAAYQALLAVDYLVDNRARRSVLVGEGNRLVAVRDNDAFTPRAVEGALDPFARLARHVFHSAALANRLRALDRDRLVAALRIGRGVELFTTPKELEQILDRKRGLENLARRALALP
jgi:hypothetical protein